MNYFDDFIQKGLEEWKIPGMAISVIKNNDIILSKGYGYRDLEKKLPVTPQTLFNIASCSKSFIATLACVLIDEGIIDINKPIIEYIPDFKMFDPYTTNHLNLRDILCHRSGLPGS